MSTSQYKCTQNPEWFDGVDIEDSAGNLIGYHFPYERQAKAACAECPMLDWCRNKHENSGFEGVIIYGTTDAERTRAGRRKRKVA